MPYPQTEMGMLATRLREICSLEPCKPRGHNAYVQSEPHILTVVMDAALKFDQGQVSLLETINDLTSSLEAKRFKDSVARRYDCSELALDFLVGYTRLVDTFKQTK